MEHDFQIRILFATLAGLAGFEAVKSLDWRRWVFWPVAGFCGLMVLVWPTVKPLYAPATAFVASIASNSQTWFILAILGFVSIAVTGRWTPRTTSTEANSNKDLSRSKADLAAMEARIIAAVKPQGDEKAENPRLDLVFGEHAHYPMATRMENVHSWYVYVQNINTTDKQGKVSLFKTFTTIFLVFHKEVHISYLKVEGNKTLPSYQILHQGSRHLIVHFDGTLSGTAVSLITNADWPDQSGSSS